MSKQKNMFKAFLIIETTLLATLGYSIFHDEDLYGLIITGFICVILGWWRRSRKRKKGISVLMVIGVFLIVVAGLSTIYSWMMLVVAALYLLVSFGSYSKGRTKSTQILNIKTKIPREKRSYFKQKWFGDRILTNTQFEWDDMTFNSIAGDMIIDLGHTILPNGDNYIVINKAFGDTKVIVPPGMGVSLKHHTILGDIQFLEQEDHLRNEMGQFYSTNYDTSTKRVKIISNNVVGDFEVIVL